MERDQEDKGTVIVRHSGEFLDRNDPLFWYSCFVRLFPRGDCAEKCAERESKLWAWRWAKTLLTRADCSLWRQDVEFIASVYNVHLRREQIQAVEACVRKTAFTEGDKANLASLTSSGLIAQALASGEVDSVRGALREKNLDATVREALKHMQLSQRRVRGSEAEKENLISKFSSLRIWSGCSSLFFTLNPHDIRSPMTISLLHSDARLEKKFSLDWDDGETEAYIENVLKDNPRRLHEAVAANPMAATRCFHRTVKLVLRTLFNCEASPGKAADGIAAGEEPGLFGYVRGFLGVVEPQMRSVALLWKSFVAGELRRVMRVVTRGGWVGVRGVVGCVRGVV